VTCPKNNGEDITCSDSVPLLQTSISQHTSYFNVEVGQTCNTDNGIPTPMLESQDAELKTIYAMFESLAGKS